jgi:hypothetical protein
MLFLSVALLMYFDSTLAALAYAAPPSPLMLLLWLPPLASLFCVAM